jgi:hypothetical protein
MCVSPLPFHRTLKHVGFYCGIKIARLFSVPCSSIYRRVCFAIYEILPVVFLTTPFSSGLVVFSLGDWFAKLRGHVIKNLEISTLEDEATALPQNVENLTQ